MKVGDKVRIIAQYSHLTRSAGLAGDGIVTRLPLPREQWRGITDRYAIVRFPGGERAINPRNLEPAGA